MGEQDFLDLSKAYNAVTINGGPKNWNMVLDKYDKVDRLQPLLAFSPPLYM